MVPVLYEELPAFIIGSGEGQTAVALGDERDRFRPCLLGAQHLRLRAPKLGFNFRR
jgi:hypothetical protein